MHSAVQLATQGVCVLYMNIRPRSDKIGFPERDDTPADILTASCARKDEYRIRCVAFFATIFKVLRTRLGQDQTKWRQEMCRIRSPTRNSFFVDLAKEYVNVSTMDV
jgi:hypothetical protein